VLDTPKKTRFLSKVRSFFLLKLLGLYLWGSRLIMKRASHIRRVAHLKATLIAWNIFPDNLLNDAYDLVSDVFAHLTVYERKVPLELSEQATTLLKKVLEDKAINIDLSKYYLVLAYSYSRHNKIFDTFKDEEVSCLEKAVELNPLATPLNEKEVHNLNKQYKKEYGRLLNVTREKVKERVNEIRDRSIPEISINLVDISLAMSIFGTLFFVGGYYYINKLLGHFNYDVGLFYTASDFYSASLTYAMQPLLFTCFFALVLTLSAYERYKDNIRKEQFELSTEITNPKRDPVYITVFLYSYLIPGL
jgi:hypothetical protein